MKKEIINYTEFLAAVESIFPQNSVYDAKAFAEEVAASKHRRKTKIADISARIKDIKSSIETYKAQIKKAASKSDKKEYGIRLNQFITAKKELLKTYKEAKNLTSFSELSSDVKTYLCTYRLFNKYLLTSFVKSSQEAVQFNADGTATLNVELFRNSVIYQQAQHIKDYVKSYIEHYPHRVSGSRYFVGLHKTLTEFEDIADAADEYFENINQQNAKSEENLQKSREGIEVTGVYPEYNVQAVKLITADALKYEGAKMSHCVTTYANSVEKGETEIYSIRDIGDEYTEFAPHATIEFKKGLVTQIRGYKNGLIDISYIKATRRLLMQLLNMHDESEILTTADISQSEKDNIGFLKDINGVTRDILDVRANDDDIIFNKLELKANRMKYANFKGIKFNEINVSGVITAKTLKQLKERMCYKKLSLRYDNDTLEKILDLSMVPCKQIHLNFKKAASDIEQIILPADVEEVLITDSSLNNLSSISGVHNLRKLKLFGKFDSLKHIPEVQDELNIQNSGNKISVDIKSNTLKSLTLEGVSCALEPLFLPTLENLSLTGEWNSLKDLSSANIRELHLSGKFNALQTLPETITNLFLRGEFATLSSFPKSLSELKLNSDNVSLHTISHLPNLTRLQLKGNFPHLTTVSHLPSLQKLSCDDCHFPQLKHFYFSTLPQINDIGFCNCHFSVLEELIIPAQVKNFGASHSHYDALKRIDLSYMQLKSFGIVEVVGRQRIVWGTVDDSELNITMPECQSYIANFVSMPSIQEIKLREDIEVIDCSGMKFGATNPFDFTRYKALKRLNLKSSKFPAGQKLDLSKCTQLQELDAQLEQLPDIIPAPNLKELELRSDPKEAAKISYTSVCENATKLTADFALDKKDVPPSVKDMTMFLMNDMSYGIKEIDFPTIHHLKLQTSANASFPELRRIAMPQSFERLFLFNPSPKLTEIDLHQVDGKVEIKEIDYKDEVQPADKKDEKEIYLLPEQFEILKKIKLGGKTELCLPQSAENKPFIIELAADMPLEKEQELKAKYPHIRVIRVPQAQAFQHLNSGAGR